MARQLQLVPQQLELYGKRDQTRTDHIQSITQYLDFKKADIVYFRTLTVWLTKRALEHDKPLLLLKLCCEKLQQDKVIRPGITVLEGITNKARAKAQSQTYQKLCHNLSDHRKQLLDKILVNDDSLKQTPLAWLRFGEVSNTPSAILNALQKLAYLRSLGVDTWDLSVLNPNRRKLLAYLGRQSSNQALQRSAPERSYPILMAFLKQTMEDVIDEVIELFDRCLWDCNSRAKNDLDEFKVSHAKAANEKLRLLKVIGEVVLDSDILDIDVRKTIYQEIDQELLKQNIIECNQLIRPADDNAYEFLANRFSYLREFTPAFFDALEFKSNRKHPILEAIDVLKIINAENKKSLPEDAPIKFVPSSWKPYIFKESGKVERKYYEICALWELRSALRSGAIWVKGSRKYTDPESYLIPKNFWPSMRAEACELLGLPERCNVWLRSQELELENLLLMVDKQFPANPNARIENGKLILSPLFAENLSDSVSDLQNLITNELPRLDITDLLVEVDHWTHFSDCFTHAAGSQPRTKDFLVHLYASILAQTCNFGLKKMAEITGLTYDKLAWCTTWYLREETIQDAINCLVNYQYHQPLSKYFGGGTMSSSDGQRFPVPIKARNAVALPKYFGYGKGLTFYSWTSDQFSQYGSKVIPATVRDATYVLDAILDNETELQLIEHTTDTAGYTELVFGLFALLGLIFSPRIRDLGDQHLYRISRVIYQNIESILKGPLHRNYITDHWDNILRLSASLKLGYVSASLMISKLKSYPKQHVLVKAIQELGRLRKTVHILNALNSEPYRRRYCVQLNKGEAMHSLRSYLRYANEGSIRKSQPDDQANQAACLTLFANAVVVWNTRYSQAIIDRYKATDGKINEEDLKHFSPCRFEHINKYGKLRFNIDKEMSRKGLRPLHKVR